MQNMDISDVVRATIQAHLNARGNVELSQLDAENLQQTIQTAIREA